MAGVNKRPVGITPEMSKWFEKCPKMVLFMIAYSVCLQRTGDEDPRAAFNMMREEWEVLYANKFVPQKPVR